MKASSSESDIGDYLSTLKKKTIGNKLDIHIDGFSDLSLSELSDKKDKPIVLNSKFLKNQREAAPVDSKNANSKTKKGKKKKNKDKSTKNKNKENINKKTNSKEFRYDFSDSDLNFSLSSNSKEKRSFKETSNSIPELHLDLSRNKAKSNRKLSEKSDDNDESSFGKDGNRFLKTKPIVRVDPPATIDTGKSVPSDELSSSRDVSSPRKSTLRGARSSISKKKVTILENKQVDSLSSLDFEIPNSFEETTKSKSDSGSDNDKNFCGMNIMSINDLVREDIDEHSVEDNLSNQGHSSKFGKILTIEELEDDFNNKQEDRRASKKMQDSNDSLSEIKTMPSFTPRKSANLSRNQSISEVISTSLREPSEINSSNSKIESLEFEESRKEKTRLPISISKKSSKMSPSYSSDFTDEDGTLRSISKSSMKEIHKKSPKIQQNYQWNSKHHNQPQIPAGSIIENVDPVPIAPYVVSPEALESLTAYSPSLLLMTHMFRQQIQMTTNFIETQQRLYESLISSVQSTYRYSSLQEVKDFIKSNKRKPLTMKEALRLIENEN